MATSTRTVPTSHRSLSSNNAPTGEFSIRQARGIVGDLFIPNRLIYWTDFLVSLTIGMLFYGLVQSRFVADAAAAQVGGGAIASWSLTVAFFFVSCIAFYRAALFTHELVHLRPGAIPGFRKAWNISCGVPFLMPTFLYHTHVHHHARKHYGTQGDGEYLPLATGGPGQIFLYLAQSLVIPLLAALRFTVLSPLAWCSPKLRGFIQQRASSMVIDPTFVRPVPSPKELELWKRQERACFVFCLAVGLLLATEVLPLVWLLQAYLTGVTIIFVNSVRTLGAHRYRLLGESSFSEQLQDSLNYPHWPLVSELWAPVGLRFHALHHLFPSLPYHNLAEAHRRLMRELPADSIYRQTESPGLFFQIGQLWRDSCATRRRQQDA